MRLKVIMNFAMSFQPCQGRYLRIYNQARTLVQHGYDVVILAWDREGDNPLEELRDGIKIRRFRIKAGVMRGPLRNVVNVLRFNWAVFKYISKAEFDVAHCYNLDAIVATLLGAKLRGKRSVLDLCEPEYYACWDKRWAPLLKIVNLLESRLAKRYDHVLVHNAYQVRKLKDKGVQHITQVGSYPSRDFPPLEVETAPEKTKNVVVIGRIGTFYENNGLEELLEAFNVLAARQNQIKRPIVYRLLLAGRVLDHYKPTFAKLIEPLKSSIDVHGPFDSKDMGTLYQKIDISAIVVRKTDWFRHITPTKLFDSMAYGVAVVANDIGEVKQIVTEAHCGIIVDEKDIASIVNALEILGTDAKMRRAMGDRGRRLSRNKYTWEAQQSGFCAVYRGLMAKQPLGLSRKAPR